VLADFHQTLLSHPRPHRRVRAIVASESLSCHYVQIRQFVNAASPPRPSKHLRGLLPPLVSGDTPLLVTEDRVLTARGLLVYEAGVGRLAIRNSAQL
jgi:hypothetical protein